MAHQVNLFTIEGESPDTASTAAVGDAIKLFRAFDWFTIFAELVGTTNGAVDACLQVKTPGIDEWWDWIRFPQVAAGATKYYAVQVNPTNTITETGKSTTATPTITLAANTNIGGMPTGDVRLVVTGGAGTDSAATQTIRLVAYREQ